jgi:hypothetical protein
MILDRFILWDFDGTLAIREGMWGQLRSGCADVDLLLAWRDVGGA